MTSCLLTSGSDIAFAQKVAEIKSDVVTSENVTRLPRFDASFLEQCDGIVGARSPFLYKRDGQDFLVAFCLRNVNDAIQSEIAIVTSLKTGTTRVCDHYLRKKPTTCWQYLNSQNENMARVNYALSSAKNYKQRLPFIQNGLVSAIRQHAPLTTRETLFYSYSDGLQGHIQYISYKNDPFGKRIMQYRNKIIKGAPTSYSTQQLAIIGFGSRTNPDKAVLVSDKVIITSDLRALLQNGIICSDFAIVPIPAENIITGRQFDYSSWYSELKSRTPFREGTKNCL